MSTSCFVPKPFTPFQWEPQDTLEQLDEKQQHLKSSIRTKKVSLSYHDAKTSFLEAVLARGDRRLCRVLEEGCRRGFNLDSWSEHFDFDAWMEIFEECGLDPKFYANRRREYGVTKSFLISENKLAHAATTTPNCRQACSGCGAACWKEGVCVEKRANCVQ